MKSHLLLANVSDSLFLSSMIIIILILMFMVLYYRRKSKTIITEDNKVAESGSMSIEEKKKLDYIEKILSFSLPSLNAFSWILNGRTRSISYSYEDFIKSDIFQFNTLDKCIEILHPDDRENYISKMNEALNKGEGELCITYRSLVDESRGYDWWEIRGKVETINDGDSSYPVIYGIALLLNDAKHREDVLIKQNEETEFSRDKAETADRLKSQFLANMSHEIRTPLNAIVGFSELISETTDEEDKREYVEIIKMNNEMLLRLIGDILDLSKLESGTTVINPTPLDAVEVLNNSYSYWSRRFASKNIKFELITPCKVCQVCLDEKSVLQMLTNFLSNAFKYTVSGSVSLELEIVEGGVKFSVKDTGIGIPESKKELVFGRFSKLDEFAQGTGLGLSICKALVEMSGGEIGFISEEGLGTTFWAFLPTEVFSAEKLQTASRDNIEKLMEKQLETGEKRKKILIAEDNDSNYKLTEAILKNDYDLVRATNGEVAMTLFSRDIFDLVLMDMRMPVMDGMTAVKKIRKFNKEIPIVAITANAFDTDRVTALDAGCTGFMSKPLNKKKLLSEVEKLLLQSSSAEIIRGGGGGNASKSITCKITTFCF